MMHYIPTRTGGWLLAATTSSVLFVQVGPEFPRPNASADSHEGADPVGTLAVSVLEALEASDPIQAALELLTSGGLAATPAFVVLTRRDAQSIHLLVRGSGFAHAETTSGPQRVTGSGVSTWREMTIEGVTTLELGAQVEGAGGSPAAIASDPTLAERLPLSSGVVWASGVHLSLVDAADEVAAPARDSADPAPAPSPALTPVPTAAPAPAPVSVPEPEPELEPEPEPEPEPEDDAYSHLFEETIVRTMEEAAVRPVATDDDEELPAPVPASAHAGLAQHDAANANTNSESLSASVENTGQYVDESDLAEDGVRHEASTAVSTEAGSGDSPFGIPAFDAISPRSEHSDGPSLVRSFYLDVSTGGREPLTAPILVGRAPSVSKVPSGLVPRLITIPGDQDISRNHVRIALEGDTVVVTDLDSRNGTAIILPGKPSQKLRRSEPTAVLVDTVIDLGGGVTLTVREEK